MALSKTTFWGISAAAAALVTTVPLCLHRLEEVFGAAVPVWLTQSLVIVQIIAMLVGAVAGALFAINAIAGNDIRPSAAAIVLKQPEKAGVEEAKP